MIGIYKITSPTNRIYIGQSINIESRYNTYKQMNIKTKRQPLLYKSFVKYGFENHIFEVLEICIIDEINNRERYWQEYYNVLEGGLNCVYQKTHIKKRQVSLVTRKKISEALKGKKISEKNIEKLRKRMIGNSYCKGKKRSQCVKKSISKKMKIISAGKNNNMYGKFGEDNPNSKIILNIETGIFYFGCNEASIYNNLTISKVKKSLSNIIKNNTPLIYA